MKDGKEQRESRIGLLRSTIIVTLGITIPLFIVAKIVGGMSDSWLNSLINLATPILTGIIATYAFKTYNKMEKAHKNEADDRAKEAQFREKALQKEVETRKIEALLREEILRKEIERHDENNKLNQSKEACDTYQNYLDKLCKMLQNGTESNFFLIEKITNTYNKLIIVEKLVNAKHHLELIAISHLQLKDAILLYWRRNKCNNAQATFFGKAASFDHRKSYYLADEADYLVNEWSRRNAYCENCLKGQINCPKSYRNRSFYISRIGENYLEKMLALTYRHECESLQETCNQITSYTSKTSNFPNFFSQIALDFPIVLAHLMLIKQTTVQNNKLYLQNVHSTDASHCINQGLSSCWLNLPHSQEPPFILEIPVPSKLQFRL